MAGENAGEVAGKHYSEYASEVKTLRSEGREEEAEKLLWRLVEATESEARVQGCGVAPFYYEQLAISYAKRGECGAEIAVLERFAGQPHAPGVKPPRLLARLQKRRKQASQEHARREA
ncbi:MAG: hypothetical protein ACM3N0_10490 [Chloroflexota bacterium]